jgi:hypothetical protein
MPHPPKHRHIGQTVYTRGSAYATCYALRPSAPHRHEERGLGAVIYCLRTADKAPNTMTEGFLFLWGLQAKRRADERTRTADLLITSDRSGVAGVCTGLQIPHF